MCRSGEEGGDTLIEVLLTVMIIGIGVTGLLGAMGTGVSMATVQRNQAIAEAAVRGYAEAVRAAPYAVCATASASYTAVAPTVVGVTSVTATVTCDAADILQMVTVSVSSADDKVGVLSLQVAKPRLSP